jgi:hypothetical protein
LVFYGGRRRHSVREKRIVRGCGELVVDTTHRRLGRNRSPSQQGWELPLRAASSLAFALQSQSSGLFMNLLSNLFVHMSSSLNMHLIILLKLRRNLLAFGHCSYIV